MSISIKNTLGGQSASGSLTATDEVILLFVAGYAALGIQIANTFTGTVYLEATADGANWSALSASGIDGSAAVTSATSAGQWIASVAGLVAVRARMAGYLGGVADVTLRCVASGANGGIAGAVTIANGANVALGSTTDTAVGDDTGTLIAHVRYLCKVFADVWSAITHAIKVDGSAFTQPISGTITATPTKASTGTTTSVNDQATNITVLAANANRLGATLYNDSDQIAYVKCGATASATDFTKQLLPGDYWPVPSNYSGIIDALWASNSTGAMRVTEFT